MNRYVALWRGEHANFERLLDLFEEQLNAFHEGETPNYDLMCDIVFYLSHYADRFHHPREDVAFDRMVLRDPRLRQQVRRLQQEHRVIAAAGNELLERLREVEQDAMLPRKVVESAAATYLVYYRHHLGVEEREMLAHAEELLTEDDWLAVLEGVPVTPDPLYGDNPDQRLRELRRHISREAAAG